jgi:hypothetical protein
MPGSLDFARPQPNRVTQGQFALGSAAISLPAVCFFYNQAEHPGHWSWQSLTRAFRPFGMPVDSSVDVEIGRRQLLPLSSNFSTHLKINIRAYMHEDNTLLILLSAHPPPRDTLK